MTDPSIPPVRNRLHVKRYGRNIVVVLPRIGRRTVQATVYLLPSNVLLGLAWFVNDDGEREVHLGVGVALVEATFWTWEPFASGESGTS